MINVLITGAAGFIPSSLADSLLKKSNYFVVGIDNFLSGFEQNIPKHENFKFNCSTHVNNIYEHICCARRGIYNASRSSKKNR